MREAKVTFEERLVRTVTLQVPDDVKDENVMEWAEDKAREMYKAEEVVLDAEDKSGDTVMEIVDHLGRYTDWIDV